MTNEKPNREHKSTLFHVLFNTKENMLTLYNAVNGTSYKNSDDLFFTTLEDVIYVGMKNDLSFLIGHTMNLYEHQSTFNPNMPLRGFLYFAELYRGYIEENNLDLYGSSLLKLPMPQYIVFYNGEKEQEDRKILRLSDSFPSLQEKESCLECQTIMLNINIGHNKELLSHCRVLNEYAIFVGKVRAYTTNGIKLKAAISQATDECIKEGVLSDLLRKNRAEVCNMVLREYDEAAHIANEKKISEKRILLIVIQKALDAGQKKDFILNELVNDYGISQKDAEEYFLEVIESNS